MKWTVAALALVISSGAFAQAMYITPDGDVGMGTDLPISALEVTRDDGTAQILVNETSADVAARTLFQLRNPGNTKFEIVNTSANNSWAFTNSGTDFRVSLQDSGVVEFRVDNFGNAFLAGDLTTNSDVNTKQAIVAVDPQQVLQKVVALPISQWQYKDTPGVNHVGPMAQDFHAAFGLGASNTGISTLDTSGVALAAIQALASENADLKARLEALEQQQAQMQAVMVRMLEQQAKPSVVRAGLN